VVLTGRERERARDAGDEIEATAERLPYISGF
jgi:hypothetical protein